MANRVFQATAIIAILLLMNSNPVNAGRIINYCDNCHVKLLKAGDYHEVHYFNRKVKEYSCEFCHIANSKVVSNVSCATCHLPLLPKIHKGTCLICHKQVLKIENLSTSDIIHKIHSRKLQECKTCHEMPTKISADCTKCHGTDHHNIHQRIINRICTNCHGDIGKAYANISLGRAPENLVTSKVKNASGEYWTEKLSPIRKLIKSILDKFLVY